MDYTARISHGLREILSNSSICSVLFFLLLSPAALAQKDQDFSYNPLSPNGPANWGGICNSGTRQSPIAIDTNAPVDNSLPVLPLTNYVTTNASLYNDGYSPELTGNFGNFTIGNKTYNFNNIHFHRPAEHILIYYPRYVLEMHIVHVSADGEIAVIAVFFKIGPYSPFLAQFFDLLPQIKGRAKPTLSVPNVAPNFKISGKYARYVGSLTTPPCDEGVIWTVMFHPNTLSYEQLFKFQISFPGPSARQIQPLNGRLVTTSPSM